MEKQFALMLENRRRSWGLLLAFPVLVFTGIWVVMTLMDSFYPPDRQGKLIVSFGLMISFGFATIYSLTRLNSDAALVTVGADKLVVVYHKSGVELQLPFAFIASYEVSSAKGGAGLHCICRDRSSKRISAGYQTARFLLMTNAFEEALYRYQHGHDKPPAVSLIPSFFQTKGATILLIGLAVALGSATLLTGPPDASDSRSFFLFMGYAAMAGYTLIWAMARRRHQVRPHLR